MSGSTRFFDDFFDDLSEQANLPVEDARELTEDFLMALPGFVSRQTWELVSSLAPVEVSVDWEDIPDREDRSMEAFLLEMSQEEEVELERSAEHARAVAETITSHATAAQVESLRSAIRDENLLALFETARGELTSPDPSERPDGQSGP